VEKQIGNGHFPDVCLEKVTAQSCAGSVTMFSTTNGVHTSACTPLTNACFVVVVIASTPCLVEMMSEKISAFPYCIA
jgi:hypothetical protein